MSEEIEAVNFAVLTYLRNFYLSFETTKKMLHLCFVL